MPYGAPSSGRGCVGPEGGKEKWMAVGWMGPPIPVANPHGLGRADRTKEQVTIHVPRWSPFPWADLPETGTEGDMSGQSTPSMDP